MPTNSQKSNRGGKRAGAGRKPMDPANKRVGILFKFHPSTIAALKATKGNKRWLVETLIRNLLKLPPL